MAEKRVNIVVLIVGDRGTGKTTYMKGEPAKNIKGILPSYVHRNASQKILVIDTYDNPVWRDYPPITIDQLPAWESGARRIWSSEPKVLLQSIAKYCYNTVLVVEDATKFIFGRLTEDTKRFVLDSKQKNLDIYFIFHFLGAVPPDLTRISDVLVLFKTKEIFDSRLKSKYPNPDILEGYLKVQAAKSWYFNKAIKISG